MSVFFRQVVSKPLLSDCEINQLINVAPIRQSINMTQLSHGARMGEKIASATGSGSDFSELRAYQAGDDPRYIDWRATARSSVPLVRIYHSEISQPLCLVIDRRSAMRFATRVRLKVAQALRMALWIGGREASCGREISAVILDKPCHWLPAQQGRMSLQKMAKVANMPCPPIVLDDCYEMKWKQIFSGLQQHVDRGSELYLLSDFYGLQTEDEKMLRMLGNFCKATAIQISDPTEISSSFLTDVKLHGLKSKSLFTSKKVPSKTALNIQLKSRTEKISRCFRKANINYYQLSVEQEELSALFVETQK